MDQQHAPAPDYGPHQPAAELYKVSIQCQDCHDVEEQFVAFDEILARIRRQRCDECQAQHDDEKRTRMRLTVTEAMRRVLDMDRMRQPEEIDVMCEECAECVTSCVGPVDHLDGKAGQCPACETFGKIIVGDDEGATHIRFRAYTAKEIAGGAHLPVKRGK